MNQNQLLTSALDCKSSLTVANYYDTICTLNVVCIDGESGFSYAYDAPTAMWQSIGINQVAVKIQQELYANLLQKEAEATNLNRGKEHKLLLKSVGTLRFCVDVARTFLAKRVDKKFFDKLDSNRDVFNFKNGLVDLKTGQFRPRTKDDYISKCLSYDYVPTVNTKVRDRILDILLKICNDSKEDLTDLLTWDGYCMTGQTKQQKCMFHIGHKASNGKSTSLKMFGHAFPIYTFKLDRKTFNAGYPMVHKQFAMLRAPVRKCYVEEQEGHLLDVALLKNFVDGDKENLNVMYGVATEFDIHAKLEMTSNKIPKFPTDNGIGRRGLSIEHTNKFFDRKEEYDALPDKKKCYMADLTIDDFMKSSEFGINYFHILIQYAMAYYKNGLQMTKKSNDSFKEICDDNDKFKEFMLKTFEKTDNKEDRIHKDEILQAYRQYSGHNNTEFQFILNEIKRLQFDYERQMRKKGFVTQGCLTGLKFREPEPEDEEFVIGEDIEPKKKRHEIAMVERVVEEKLSVDEMLARVFEHYDMNPDELIERIKNRYPLAFDKHANGKTVIVSKKKEKKEKKPKQEEEEDLEELARQFDAMH